MLLILEFRYLRWSTSGSTFDEDTHFVELQILTNDGTNTITPATPITIVTSNKNVNPDHPLSSVVDGSTDSNQYFATYTGDYPSTSIEVDLGSITSNLALVKFWHYYLDSRTYYNVQLMISKDRLRWHRIYGPTSTLATEEGTEIILATHDSRLSFYVIPSSYSYTVQPDYIDIGNMELTDGIIAEKYYINGAPTHTAWSAWVGWGWGANPTITFNFHFNVTISNVSIHFQGDHRGSIKLPSTLNIEQTHFDIGDLSINGWLVFTGHWEGSNITLAFTNLPESFIFISEVMFAEAQGNQDLI